MNSSINKLLEIFPFASGISTDSRNVAAGNIFFALRGDNFDGNNYARQALDKGALCAVVERGSEFGRRVMEAKFSSKYENEVDRDRLKRYLLVDSPLRALQILAKWHRGAFRIPIIALTGTNGKTTTKELIRAVLSKRYRVVATEGNLNNSIGVPLTLFNISLSTQIAIIEMGASHPGDIKELVEIACPNHGLITNIGRAHLQGFGSYEGVKSTKGELYDYLEGHSGVVFLDVDNPELFEMVDSRPMIKPITYGVKHQNVKVLPVKPQHPYLTIEMGGVIINTHLIGNYNVNNVLAALAIGEHFGVSMDEAVEAIEGYIPTNNRSELKKTLKNTLIIDAYNANPTSMMASLANFQSIKGKNKVLILGDMRELGEYSSQEHKDILKYALGMDVKRILLVGHEFGTLKGYVDTLDGKVSPLFFEDVNKLREYIHKEHIWGATILIKGSNGIKLQSIVQDL